MITTDMTQDSFQSTGILSRTWNTIETMISSDDVKVPDYRGYGQDAEVFKKVASICIQSAVPRKKWLSNFDKKPISEFVTVAEEALAYLILENNFVDWMNIAKKNV